MEYAIYRNNDEDLAIGINDCKVYVRRGKAMSALKKATVFPFKTQKEAIQHKESLCKEIKKQGYVAISVKTTTDDKPYPICREDGKLHWACGLRSNSNRAAGADNAEAAFIASVFDVAIVIASFTGMSASMSDAGDVVTLHDQGADYTFGFQDNCNVCFSTEKVTGGALSVDYNCAFVAMMLALSEKDGDYEITLSNDAGVEITSNIEETMLYLPLADRKEFLKLCEALKLCVAPVEWQNIQHNSQSAVWQF